MSSAKRRQLCLGLIVLIGEEYFRNRVHLHYRATSATAMKAVTEQEKAKCQFLYLSMWTSWQEA